jgi:Phage ABA sandwich domain
MEAGVKLDLLVAEKVMGWEWQDIPRHVHIVGHEAAKDDKVLMPPNATFPPYYKGQDQLFYYAAVPAYSTILKDTFDVIQRFSQDGDFYLEKERDDPRWIASFYKEDIFETSADGQTPSQAICLSALKAVGYDTTTQS